MLERIGLYIQRYAAVYLCALPGRYTARKLKILQDFYDITNRFLKDLEVDYWISYGTLLGHYREGGIISHDIDIDYSANTNCYQKILDNKDKLPKGVKIYDYSERHFGPKLFFSYKGFDGDIYFYEEKDGLMHPTLKSSIPSDMTSFPKEHIYPLKTADFLGQETYIPNDSEAHLTHCYGYLGPNAAFDPDSGYYYPKGGPKPSESTS